jgi:hypothetical protein
MRLLAFILSLLLLAGTVDPTRGWLIALTVVTGLALFRPRFWGWLKLRPAVDVRLASFVLAVLLLAGTIDATRDWLIGLTIVTGVAMVMPRLVHLDLFGEERGHDWFDWKWDVRTERRRRKADRRWDRWERRFDRDMDRASRQWGDDWR